MRRHKDLRISTPKLLSVYCANPTVVDNWFDLYKEVLEKNDITSSLQIWNVDECGCVDCPKAKKVLTVTRVRANQLSGGDKGETTTALTFVNAAGLNTKPVNIHKGYQGDGYLEERYA